MRTYSWFLEPMNAHTNAVFAREFSEENFCRGLRDKDGSSHNLWRCPGELIARFRNSSRELGISFFVYCREGNGALRLFTPPKSRSKTKRSNAA